MLDKVFKVVQKSIKIIVSNISGAPGSKIVVNGKTYIEERLIAEGAFGYIYLVTDPMSSAQYALKRINISNKDQLEAIKSEIDVWKKITNSKFIISLVDFEITPSVAFILMEHAHEGTLLDYITKRQKSLTENEVLNILYQITCGMAHMHKQSPPIAHRDIKIENVLKCGSVFKLCDFGSASSFVLDLSKADKKTVQMQFSLFEKNSTFIYRPPEMCDLYSHYVVNEKVDVWALGCVFYAMLFKCHPFQEAQKLTIISGQYHIPECNNESCYSEKLIDLMRWMLTPNPAKRPDCLRLMDIMKKWKSVNGIELSDEVIKIKQMQKNTVNKPEIDQFFFNNSDRNIIENQDEVQEKVKGNKQEIWDFDFGNTCQSQNQSQKQWQFRANDNANLLDFEFIDNAQPPNDNISNTINSVKRSNNQVNLLDAFNQLGFDTNITNSNTNTNQQVNDNSNDSNNELFGINFDVKSKPEPVFIQSNITHNNSNQLTHNKENNAKQENSNNTGNNNTRSTGQDILSFF